LIGAAIATESGGGVLTLAIKPGSVMLSMYGETLIVDLSLAKAGVGMAVVGERHSCGASLRAGCPAAQPVEKNVK
jgi:hypothetical protein